MRRLGPASFVLSSTWGMVATCRIDGLRNERPPPSSESTTAMVSLRTKFQILFSLFAAAPPNREWPCDTTRQLRDIGTPASSAMKASCYLVSVMVFPTRHRSKRTINGWRGRPSRTLPGGLGQVKLKMVVVRGKEGLSDLNQHKAHTNTPLLHDTTATTILFVSNVVRTTITHQSLTFLRRVEHCAKCVRHLTLERPFVRSGQNTNHLSKQRLCVSRSMTRRKLLPCCFVFLHLCA